MGKAVVYLVGYAVTAWLVWAYLTQQVRPIDAQMEWIRWAFFIAFTPALVRYLIQLVVAPSHEAVMAPDDGSTDNSAAVMAALVAAGRASSTRRTRP